MAVAVDAVTAAVDVLPTFSFSNVSGVPAVTSVPAVGVPTIDCAPTVVNVTFPSILATLLLLLFHNDPALSGVAIRPSLSFVFSAVIVKCELCPESLLLPPPLLIVPSLLSTGVSYISGILALAGIHNVVNIPFSNGFSSDSDVLAVIGISGCLLCC
jgi:hypothetical protein